MSSLFLKLEMVAADTTSSGNSKKLELFLFLSSSIR